MSCDIVKVDGIVTIACSRGNRKPLPACHCGVVAVALCDFKAAGRTCDKPLCPEHRRRVTKDIDFCIGHPA